MSKKDDKSCFLIDYRDPKDGLAVSVKARKVEDSTLGISFVAISDFVFDTDSILVNPEEEAKKLKFENIETLHLSIYSILSIAEIGENNKGLEFKNDKSNLLVLKSDHPGAPTN
ncbi:MAG: DUF1820 family protein [Bdellovibrionales bacterium]|nr:DUF1820 family protein [Bdellovibrionales bacterium]NQZ18014.1 DUF1820 family protein [Bdellovibrionales bacterium]